MNTRTSITKGGRGVIELGGLDMHVTQVSEDRDQIILVDFGSVR